jgi:hypothetical protein
MKYRILVELELDGVDTETKEEFEDELAEQYGGHIIDAAEEGEPAFERATRL